MRGFAFKFSKWFGRGHAQSSRSRKPRRQLRRRLEFETLEDRCVLSGTGGVITGLAFVDANGTGIFAANDVVLTGAPITLTGTASDGTSVDMTTSTDDNGNFRFVRVEPGTYELSAGPRTGYLGGGAGFADMSGSAAGDIVSGVPLGGNQDLSYRGLDPNFINLSLLLSSTTAADFPSEATGNGIGGDSAPFVKLTIPDVNVAMNSAAQNLDLAAFFSDPDITNSMVQFDLNNGQSINVELFDTTAPQTVTNFFDYINSGSYNSSIFHRLVTSPDVLQGGGFTFDPNSLTINTINANPAVPNEFGASNVTGTLAMAQVGGNINSATTQFFFNLSDNSGGASNLDGQKFTVFGQVVSPSDQQVLNNLANTPVFNESNANSAFNTIPINAINGLPTTPNDPNFPTDTTAANYLLVNNIAIVSQNESLTYQVVSNTNPTLVAATLAAEHLTLQFTTGMTGTAVITVQATDQFGLTAQTSFNVSVT